MKYKSKVVEIEAVQWNGDNTSEVLEFCKGDAVRTFRCKRISPHVRDDEKIPLILIHTFTGDMHARVGDFIIRGYNNGLLSMPSGYI